MPDTSRVIPAIESDRADRPRAELGGDGLHGAYVSECAFAPPLRYVNHVHCFDFWWEFFLSPSVLLVRLILVFTWCLPPLLFSVYFAGLLEDPTFFVRVVRWFFGGAMNLT